LVRKDQEGRKVMKARWGHKELKDRQDRKARKVTSDQWGRKDIKDRKDRQERPYKFLANIQPSKRCGRHIRLAN
jgi:hypothetical protein